VSTDKVYLLCWGDLVIKTLVSCPELRGGATSRYSRSCTRSSRSASRLSRESASRSRSGRSIPAPYCCRIVVRQPQVEGGEIRSPVTPGRTVVDRQVDSWSLRIMPRDGPWA